MPEGQRERRAVCSADPEQYGLQLTRRWLGCDHTAAAPPPGLSDSGVKPFPVSCCAGTRKHVPMALT